MPIDTETQQGQSQVFLATHRPVKPMDEMAFIDLLDLFAKKRSFILKGCLAGMGVGVAIAFLLPEMFTGITLIMPPQQQQSTASTLMGQLAPLAGLAGHDIGLKNPGDLYVGILKSQSVKKFVIDHLDLKSVYRAKTFTDAADLLMSRTKIVSGLDSLIKISVEDRDPKRAADIANAYVDGLFAQNSRLAVTTEGRRRLFYEKRLESEKQELASAEYALTKLQQRTGILQPTGQVEMTLRSLAQVKAQIALREVELQAFRQAATDQNPQVIRQETELTALRSQLQQLASSVTSNSDPFISPSKMPVSNIDYLRAMRDLKYHESLVELLAKEYEVARMDEARDADLIQVVDHATPPEYKSSPHRFFVVVVATMGAAMISALYAIFRQALLSPV
jgi:tyrosine-protein kinase Etk/Wzc